MEIWDLYDRNENSTGKKWKRSEARLIPDGFYYLACEVLVRHIDGDFLLMQRDFSKKFGPGCWEATAGGAAMQGESALSCAKRELFEETGLVSDNFKEIGYSIEDGKHGIYHSYLAIVNCAKDSIKLQQGETIDYKWISKREFIEFMKTDQMGEDQIARYSAYMKSLKNARQYCSFATY